MRILDVLARYSAPVKVGSLATAANLNVTPLVLTLQQLRGLGVIALDPQRDEVALTDLGRQMLRVQKSLEASKDTAAGVG